ncbi:MAG: hypothetical protein JRG89_08520 [Deltaproteobacteria bacterium]|nr:hypothetical protein [Deltaproteobacteria bacterium]MBW2388468.1 hypothetical protein [Deltaproteobacteria bacterium]
MSDGVGVGHDHSVSIVLARALRRLLRPLVRLLLEKQLSFPFVSNLLKALYIEVAEHELAIPGKRGTDSRISLLTGIHRREVKRIRGELRNHDGIPSVLTLGALLVSRWIGDPRYLDAEGRPRTLPRRAAEPAPSFESLVASVSTDIPPRSILDEWLRLGVVQEVEEDGEDGEDEQGLVRLVVESFGPEQGFDEKAHFFGRNLRDHIATGAHNLLGIEPPFLDRSIYYDDLRKESIEKLAEIVREEGSALLRRVNRHALEFQRADAGEEQATHRMTFGSYFYAVDELEEPDSGLSSAKDAKEDNDED